MANFFKNYIKNKFIERHENFEYKVLCTQNICLKIYVLT